MATASRTTHFTEVGVFINILAGMRRRAPHGAEPEEAMNRVAGIGTSLVLIAAGAIMAFAVSVQTDGFNVNTIGWILMAVGAVGLIVSIIVGTASASTGGVTYVDRTVVEREPVRERIVERDRL